MYIADEKTKKKLKQLIFIIFQYYFILKCHAGNSLYGYSLYTVQRILLNKQHFFIVAFLQICFTMASLFIYFCLTHIIQRFEF